MLTNPNRSPSSKVTHPFVIRIYIFNLPRALCTRTYRSSWISSGFGADAACAWGCDWDMCTSESDVATPTIFNSDVTWGLTAAVWNCTNCWYAGAVRTKLSGIASPCLANASSTLRLCWSSITNSLRRAVSQCKVQYMNLLWIGHIIQQYFTWRVKLIRGSKDWQPLAVKGQLLLLVRRFKIQDLSNSTLITYLGVRYWFNHGTCLEEIATRQTLVER